MTATEEIDLLRERIARLESITDLLADGLIMCALWLSRLPDDDVLQYREKWFARLLEGIVDCHSDPHLIHEHLTRFARKFKEMDSLPRGSAVSQKVWTDIIDRIRSEAEESR